MSDRTPYGPQHPDESPSSPSSARSEAARSEAARSEAARSEAARSEAARAEAPSAARAALPSEVPVIPRPREGTAATGGPREAGGTGGTGEATDEWKTRGERALERGVARVTGRALGPYQSAVVRIGFAATWLFFLLREWPHRDELYGPGSPWGLDLAEQLLASNQAFTVLLWSSSMVWFELVYALAILSSVTLLLGWRTRTSAVLFMVGVLSLQNRSVFMGDGGDNVIHLMAIYLVLLRCGQVWSLDARRLARGALDRRDTTGVVLWTLTGAALAVIALGPGLSAGWAVIYWGLWAVAALWWAVNRFAPGQPRVLCDVLANLAHNAALFVIMAEVCLVYATAGWYKVQGSRWQDGTAVYYPMHLDYFAPWPDLAALLAGSGLMVMLITYGTVIVQVAFPFTLFNRRVKNVLLAIMITEHLSIAVLLGLPFFSLAMVAADAVFLPTVFLVWIGARGAGLTARLRGRPSGASGTGAGTGGTDPAAGAGHGDRTAGDLVRPGVRGGGSGPAT